MILLYMSYEENIQSYRDNMTSLIGNQFANSAQKIAEGDELGNQAREATAQIVGPLALDMLREGIMHKAGVASARIGGKTVRAQINEALKAKYQELSDRATNAARGKIQDVVDQVRGTVASASEEGQEALTSAVGTARDVVQSTSNRAVSNARDALPQGSVQTPAASTDDDVPSGSGDDNTTEATMPTEDAPSFFSVGNIAERSGDALGAAAAGIGAAYAVSRPGLSSDQRAVIGIEAAAPLVAEKSIGDIVPGAGLIVGGIEDAATPGLGTAVQRTEDFGIQAGVLAAQKVGYKAGQAAQRAIQGARAGQQAEEDTDIGGEGGTELTDISAIGTTATSEAETTGVGAGLSEATGAELGAGASAGLGAELGTDAALAAASGPESGGLGFIAAGAIGLGAVLASIFAPHHHKSASSGPAPNLAIPVQAVGLR